MSFYDLFIGSSVVEYETERERLHNLLVKLGRCAGVELRVHLCEYVGKAITLRPDGKQGEYNDLIDRCDTALFLFGSKVGRFTLGELQYALAAQRQTGAPTVIVLTDSRKPPLTDAQQQENRLALQSLLEKHPHEIAACACDGFDGMCERLLLLLQEPLGYRAALQNGVWCVNGKKIMRQSIGKRI